GLGGYLDEPVVVGLLVRRDGDDGVAGVVDVDVLPVEAVEAPALAGSGPGGEAVSGEAAGAAARIGLHPVRAHGIDPPSADEAPAVPDAAVAQQASDPRELRGAQLQTGATDDPAERAPVPLRVVDAERVEQARQQPVPHVAHEHRSEEHTSELQSRE